MGTKTKISAMLAALFASYGSCMPEYDDGQPLDIAMCEEADNETKFKLTATDMVKIGQLFLNGGKYGGKQIISEDYIKQAVTPLKCNPGYGFLWWVWEDQYGCRGYGGQSITVIPDENAVIVTQATPTDRGMGYFDVVDYCREILLF